MSRGAKVLMGLLPALLLTISRVRVLPNANPIILYALSRSFYTLMYSITDRLSNHFVLYHHILKLKNNDEYLVSLEIRVQD